MKRYWVLMYYGVESGDCHGITDSEEVANAWSDSDYEHTSIEFKLNVVEEIPSWVQDKKLDRLKAALEAATS